MKIQTQHQKATLTYIVSRPDASGATKYNRTYYNLWCCLHWMWCGVVWQIPDRKLVLLRADKVKMFCNALSHPVWIYDVTAKTWRVWSKEKWTLKIDDSNVNGLNGFEWVSEWVSEWVRPSVTDAGLQWVHRFNVSLLYPNLFSRSELKYLLLLSLWL